MKKLFTILTSFVFIASMSFAQIEVDNMGNTGVGVEPTADAKMSLQTANKYGLHIINDGFSNGSYYPSISGHGIYVKNKASGYTGSATGISIDNTSSGVGSGATGLIINNISYGSSVTARGINVTNTVNGAASGDAYGARLAATALDNSNLLLYGLYASVSGTTAANTYAGYFDGGKVVVMNGNVGIGRQPSYLLDVNGAIRVSSTLYSSDERLKTNIKNVTTETEKLYKLQGKSYTKSLEPTFEIVNDTVREKKDATTFFEYGYLAQELQAVFPELVSQDTAGYYAVNYVALIPVIVEALKSQQQEIETLKKALYGTTLKSTETVANQELFLSDNSGAEDLKLYQNAPNPFNERTTIKCYVPQSLQKVQLCVYNMQGMQVQCLNITERGNVELNIEASTLTAGVYSYVLIANGTASETKQMILTKY